MKDIRCHLCKKEADYLITIGETLRVCPKCHHDALRKANGVKK